MPCHIGRLKFPLPPWSTRPHRPVSSSKSPSISQRPICRGTSAIQCTPISKGAVRYIFGAFLYSTAMFATVRSDRQSRSSGPLRTSLNRLVTTEILSEEETNHALGDGKMCISARSVNIRISWVSLTVYAYITLHMQPALHAVSMNLGISLSLLSC